MDGVISDTQNLHAQVEHELLGKFGIDISPEEITEKYAGAKTKDFIDELLNKAGKDHDMDQIMKNKWFRMEELAGGSIKSIHGSIELIKEFYNHGFSLAVASASDIEYVKEVLTSLGVIDYFEAVIGGDMVKKGKPDPEIFLLAASKIGINPEDCLVIEDGHAGMEAAARAGMKCIGLVSDKKKEYPTKNIVTSLSEITLDYIEQLK
jgi:HAD superfamily hydrolase (TIGR01509 family)